MTPETTLGRVVFLRKPSPPRLHESHHLEHIRGAGQNAFDKATSIALLTVLSTQEFSAAYVHRFRREGLTK
jgi:hypothetical protein